MSAILGELADTIGVRRVRLRPVRASDSIAAMPRLAKVVRIHPTTTTTYSASRARHPVGRRLVDPATVAPGVWQAAMTYAGGDVSRIVRVSWAHVWVRPA